MPNINPPIYSTARRQPPILFDSQTEDWNHPHENGVITLAPFLLHERGTHSGSCPVVNKISNGSFWIVLDRFEKSCGLQKVRTCSIHSIISVSLKKYYIEPGFQRSDASLKSPRFSTGLVLNLGDLPIYFRRECDKSIQL